MTRWLNHSIQRTEASRAAAPVIFAQSRLASAADADRCYDNTAFMRPWRFAILTLLTVGVCLTGLLVLVWNQPRPIANISLAAHGVQTNNAGTLCLVLAVTNRSNKIYGVDFATQTKSAGGWVSPSRIKRFDACDGEQLQPSSGCEVLVPVPQTGVPWRVVVAYGEHDQRPTGSLRKLWRLCRLCMRFRLREMKFLTSPGMSSNKLIEPMTSSAVLLVLQSSVNGALLVTAHPRR